MKYFKEEEFMMGNECVFWCMDEELLEHLDIIREIAGCPMRITSSYRTKEYCEKRNIPYKETSQHNFGKAVDIANTFKGETLRAITYYCLEQGLSIGISGKFIHIDNREKPSMWGYS